MAKFTKGQKVWAAVFSTNEPELDEVTVVSCGEELARVTPSGPATRYRNQVPVGDLFATKAEALNRLVRKAQLAVQRAASAHYTAMEQEKSLRALLAETEKEVQS